MTDYMAKLKTSELPMPRLELRWEELPDDAPTDGWNFGHNVRCFYMLVLAPPDKLDCRSNSEDDYGVYSVEYQLNEMRGSGYNIEDFEKGYLPTPFRDGKHIIDDKDKLNLPAFVTYKDFARELKTKDDR